MRQRDLGVQRDIYSRNQNQCASDERVKDRRKILDAIALAFEKGSGKKTFLGSLRKSACAGALLTVKQLKVMNDELERLGITRISVEVYDKQKRKRRWQSWKYKVNAEHDARVATLPKKPPQRIHDEQD